MTIFPLLALVLNSPIAAAQSTPVAGSVVRSKEGGIRRGVHREEEFIGDVRYESAGTRLTSDWALYKHADKTWQARGAVFLRRQTTDGSVFEARGQQASHNALSKRGFLDPGPGKRVLFTRTPAGLAPDHGASGRVSWNGESRVTFSSGAKVWGPRLELAADEAVYEKTGGRLILNGGRPVLRKIDGEWTTDLKADEIMATQAPRRIEARGQVKGWMIFKDPDKLKEFAK